MPLLTVRDGAHAALRRDDSPGSPDDLAAEPPDGHDGSDARAPEPERDRASDVAAVATGATRASSTERLAPERTPRLVLALPDGRRVPLSTRTLTLGRAARCDVRLADPSVSEVHCTIASTRAGWEVRDAGSTNGTRVGGVRVARALLDAGTSLALGRVTLVCARDPRDDDEEAEAPGVAYQPGALVGDSPAMARVRERIAQVAPQDYPVLVQGETGSGKELVARMVHERSRRARGPFVAINAGAIAPELVESELFGHEKGAFTGAAARRRGVFEEAHGGTLFIDELGELPLAQQAKLLRVLETREVRRVGAEGVVRVDARIVCATHRDLAAHAAAGRFRVDLLYRLDVLRVALPPLRERREDLPLLARHLLARVGAETGCRKQLDPPALAALLAHDWPGNVRELYAALCRAAAAAPGTRVGVEHLELAAPAAPPAPHGSRAGDGPGGAAARAPAPELDDAALRTLVDACGGNLSLASRSARIPRSTLRDRLARMKRE